MTAALSLTPNPGRTDGGVAHTPIGRRRHAPSRGSGASGGLAGTASVDRAEG